jgi:hypothetical protein
MSLNESFQALTYRYLDAYACDVMILKEQHLK